MILSENYIKVPGKQYKVKVQCVSTRRLTTMEWLIVNCAYKFHDSASTGNLTLKHVFEEIFQLTSSEILIKPCIESLMAEQAIQLDVGPNFEYSTLTFSKIRFTEKGKRMAEDGLFPGAARELPLDIYFNPLTEKMNQFVGGNEQVDDAIDFGAPSDYSVDFPEEKVIEALHKGLVGRGKFVASKLRIEAIDCMTSTDWDDFIKMEVETTDGSQIYTKPPIKEESVKYLITKLLQPKEVTNETIRELLWLEDAQPKKVLGAGKRIKESFLNVSKNGSVLGVSKLIYSLYKRNTSAFKNKVVVLWNETKFDIQNDNDIVFVMTPFDFDVQGCAVINEKNESLSICKKKYYYEDREVFAPIAFEDKRIILGGNNLLIWLGKTIEANCNDDIGYLSLFSLPEFAKKRAQLYVCLENVWKDVTIEKIVDDLMVLSKNCTNLKTDMVCLDDFGELLWEKLSDLPIETALDYLSKIMSLNCIHSDSKAQKHILKMVIQKSEPPKTYNELTRLLQAIGIRTREDAISYNSLTQSLYTHELLVDALQVILERKYSRLPELFAPDFLFNEYEQSIEGLEFLITSLDLFGKMDKEQLEKSIEKCPDIALIQSYVSILFLKHAELLSYGVNVHSELSNKDSEKTENFYTNIEIIKQKMEMMIREDSNSKTIESLDATKGVARNVYIIDTCALIHNPDLLLYFKEDDYVRIPTKVVDELGKIKDMRSKKYSPDLSKIASKIASDIETKYLKLFNQNNKMRLIIQNSDVDLLPADLDKDVPDNQILSVALKYKGWNAVIISDDGVFRLTSLSQNVKTIKSTEFIQDNSIYKRSLELWVEKYAKEGGKLKVKLIQNAPVNNGTSKLTSSTPVYEDESVDNLPIKELKKIIPREVNDQVITFMLNNGIKTVGQFRIHTKIEAEGFKAKGRQVILKNNVVRAIDAFQTKVSQGLIGKTSEQKLAEDEKVVEEKSSDNSQVGSESQEELSIGDNKENPNVVMPDNSDDIDENPDETAFKNAIVNKNLDAIKMSFSSLASDINNHEQAVVLRRAISALFVDDYTTVMQFILMEFPEWQIKQVVGYVDLEVKERIVPNTNWNTLIQLLYSNKEFGKIGVITKEWDISIDFDDWFANVSKEEILLQINSTYSIEMYISECLDNDEEKILDYLVNDLNVNSQVLTNVCIKNIVQRSERSALYEKILCRHYREKRAEGKTTSISLKNVVDLAIALPESEEDSLKNIVEECTTGKYQLVTNKHYAQATLTPKTMEPLSRLIEAKLSDSRIVYLYMNTKLRGEINVDRFTSELVAAGYTEYDVMDLLKDYWIIGKIKYVQDDGLVRVASGSLSNSRLMVFRSDRIRINGETGFIEPEEGMQIYFKLQDYNEGGQFYIHYPCTDIAYSK